VHAPGEYRIRRFHRGGGCGIPPFELVGKEGVDKVQRAKQAVQRCADNDKDLSKHRSFLPSRFEVEFRSAFSARFQPRPFRFLLLRHWFRIPAIGIAIGTDCFAAAWVLSLR
jgi:hypothetical protein